MWSNKCTAVRVGSSDNAERMKELKTNHERLQEMLANGWKVTSTRRAKRPRIKRPKEVIVSLFGGKVKMTFAEYKQYGDGLKVLMEIF